MATEAMKFDQLLDDARSAQGATEALKVLLAAAEKLPDRLFDRETAHLNDVMFGSGGESTFVEAQAALKETRLQLAGSLLAAHEEFYDELDVTKARCLVTSAFLLLRTPMVTRDELKILRERLARARAEKSSPSPA